MSKIETAIRLLKNPIKLVVPLDSNRMIDWMSDSTFARLSFRGEMGYRLDLNNPKTFNEKLQWLKVYDHKTEYISYVDKIKAKQIIGGIIGEQYIVPMYGAWIRGEDIPFEKLPDRFVLKCNHDQGSVILVKNKAELDIDTIHREINKKLKRNIYYGTREYPYKKIQPKVFAEKYLEEDIIDYKFYCFNGMPRFLYCGKGLTTDHSLKIDFYDLEWKRMPFYRTDYPRLGAIPRPTKLDEMIDIAKRLSKSIPFVRIDLFEVYEQVFFSEFTLCPASGFMPFFPKEYDQIVGEWLILPERSR